AFYMKPGERPNSFEFLHKTFAEYLVARRFVEMIRMGCKTFEESRESRGLRMKAFDFGLYLKDWTRLTGPRPIDHDLLQFVRDEMMRNRAVERASVKKWRDFLVRCMQENVRNGMPAHELFHLRDDQMVRRPQSFKEAVELARNAEEAL